MEKITRKLNKQSGQVIVITVALFIFLSLTAVLGIVNPVLRHIRTTTNLSESRQGYYLAESGIEDIFYRMKKGLSTPSSSTLTLNGETTTITVDDVFPGKVITSIGDNDGYIRKVQVKAILGNGISFHYGIQAGNGGFSMQNSSSVTGNVFSSGPVIGSSSNYINGDVVSAGLNGLIYGIHATGTVFAHSLGNSAQTTFADKDAYYFSSKTNTVVGGTSYPGSPDQPPAPLPISDAQIAAWENDAAAGGTISACDASGNYVVNTSVSLGPKKIACNLVVKSASGVLTVTGPLWVTGDITFQTGPTMRISPSLGSSNVAVIADNPADRSGSGVISVGQTTVFQGSGAPGSFVFLISQNNSAEMGGSVTALSMNQGASALVGYASHGLVSLSQSVGVREITAYKIALTQSANVTYDTGLPSVLFQAGPSGGYEISSWKEIE
jgi:hypothetical protein